jgi:predicted nuclease of predicted toxin-antitoxin system
VKLLFDQNISFRILPKISAYFAEAKQIRFLGLENSTDNEIWEYAKTHDLTIVTFDADFIDLTNLKGFPPKIVWLRIGNTTTENIAKVIIENHVKLEEFIENTEIAFLEITRFE